MPEMSPEVDLLERLSAEDVSLADAAFGSCYAFRDVMHARRVVRIYLKSGFVELYDQLSQDSAAIPFYSVRSIIEDDANWQKVDRYRLRLTEQGYDRYVEDSQGFFDELFSMR